MDPCVIMEEVERGRGALLLYMSNKGVSLGAVCCVKGFLDGFGPAKVTAD